MKGGHYIMARRNNIKNKPRCGYYFRYLSEYENKGFVL